MTASDRLASLGIVLPEVVTPVGTYVPATRHGDLVYTSGQLPMLQGTLVATGHVGADVTVEDANHGARVATLNALAAIAAVCGGVDNITRIVRVVGYVASAPDFTGQPAVMNGASDLLGEIFGDDGKHVRSAVGVAALPLGAAVEVELVVAVKD
jgi:enamine deaminase RidA (YjgF/YER057c/UK114 family)